MVRFLLIFALAFVLSLGLLYWTGDVIVPVFSELLSAFVIIALLAGSLSYALYSYVDGIAKEISEKSEVRYPMKFATTMRSLTDLKKEVLINACAIAVLLVLERAVYGLSLSIDPEQGQPFTWSWALALSLRLACFATSVLAAGIQFHGFLIANEYRAVLGAR